MRADGDKAFTATDIAKKLSSKYGIDRQQYLLDVAKCYDDNGKKQLFNPFADRGYSGRVGGLGAVRPDWTHLKPATAAPQFLFDKVRSASDRLSVLRGLQTGVTPETWHQCRCFSLPDQLLIEQPIQARRGAAC